MFICTSVEAVINGLIERQILENDLSNSLFLLVGTREEGLDLEHLRSLVPAEHRQLLQDTNTLDPLLKKVCSELEDAEKDLRVQWIEIPEEGIERTFIVKSINGMMADAGSDHRANAPSLGSKITADNFADYVSNRLETIANFIVLSATKKGAVKDEKTEQLTPTV